MPGNDNGSGWLGSLAALDRIVHEPGRLAILAHLSVVVKADFLYIQRQTGMTGGNLSSHIAKLEEARYIAVEKTFEGKIPRTLLRLTDRGRDAFRSYRQAIIHALTGLPE